MWETLRNAWKVEELRKKLIYTFLMLVLFRLVGVIPVSGINAAVVKEVAGNYDMLGLVNMMTGNSFSQMTIMAMGITPYINSSIIMQLLTVAIPALERLQKDGGEEGKQKINRITRYVTVALAALQAIGIIAGLQKSGNVLYPAYQNFFGYMTIGVIMAGGTALAMWIGERITKNGIGNGVSLLIFAGIISNLFNGIVLAFTDAVGITHHLAVPGHHHQLPGDHHPGYLRGYGRTPHPRSVCQARGGPQGLWRPEHLHPPEGHRCGRSAPDLRLLLHELPRHDLCLLWHQ